MNPDELSYKPSNIFDLADIQISSNEDYNAFYTRFRGAFHNNIKAVFINHQFIMILKVCDPLRRAWSELSDYVLVFIVLVIKGVNSILQKKN